LKGDDRGLAQVAASVADGDAIDWQKAESAVPAERRSLIRHLRLVESISNLYKTLPLDAPDEALAPVEEPAGRRWGRLIIREQIGEGTSCEVYRAWDSELHRDVALKLLRDEGAAAAKAHARVLEEARRLARVDHAHVVRVYGAEQHDGRVGLWMELVRGESLDDIVRARGPFSPAEASVIGQQLCAALAAVHAAGLLHRDVKAQNVMRESGGRVVLMDFGTGEILRRNEGTNRFVGTPLYLAPEIFDGRPASVQSDLYGLGVLLFHLVSGEFPHSAASMEQLAQAHALRDARRLRDVRPDLPRGFVAAVERALDRVPDRRYRTAGDMEAALRQAPENKGAATEDSAAARNRWVFAAAGLGLVIATLALIVWTRSRPTGVAAGPIRTVVVAPMAPIDPAAVPPFFAEGLTDQLISTLGQIQSLHVKSYAAVGPPGAASADSVRTASAEDVDAVLQTTLLVAGSDSGRRIRVNARLIAAGTHSVMWSQSFEEAIGDTFLIQARRARDIAAAVKAVVTPAEQALLNRQGRTTPAAEAAFLEGRAHINSYDVAAWQRALHAFQRAIDADPTHAAAHAGAARAHFTLGFSDAISQPVARALALAEAQKAIELDDTLPEAHATLADISFYYDWNWQAAKEGYLRSLNLNHSFGYGRTQYAQLLAAARQTAEAVAEAQLAVDVHPTSALAHRIHGLMLYYHRDFAGASSAIQRSLAFDRNAPGSWIILGRIAEAEGNLRAAREQTDRALSLMDTAPVLLRVQQMRLQALTGDEVKARAAFESVRRESDKRGILWNAQADAYMHLALGEHEQALDSFEKAVQQRQPTLLWLAVDPRLDSVRNHPRFIGILRSLGLG
jgi:TolB-like protein/tRNA A-37 threonylcarbamoyl transferase component Bud32